MIRKPGEVESVNIREECDKMTGCNTTLNQSSTSATFSEGGTHIVLFGQASFQRFKTGTNSIRLSETG